MLYIPPAHCVLGGQKIYIVLCAVKISLDARRALRKEKMKNKEHTPREQQRKKKEIIERVRERIDAEEKRVCSV